MARKSNKNERPDGQSTDWVVEVASSGEQQDNLAPAIDLILQAANRGDKPDLGGSGSTGLEVD